MALAKLDDVLKKAQKDHYAVGAFNYMNMEMVYGIIDAAEKTHTPVILQFAQVLDDRYDIALLGHLAIAAAKKADVPVVVHLDHGQDLEMVKKCVDLGFTGIMIDGSSKPFEENVALTKSVVDYCHSRSIPVEAELGHVGQGSEYDLSSYAYTDPDLAVEFVERTGIDALAVAIGNAHGAYKSTPKINYEVLKAVRKKVSVPLVLHGASGIPDKDIRGCIQEGITKINIFTELTEEIKGELDGHVKENQLNLFTVSDSIRTGTKNRALQKIALFGTRPD
jgi:ketose-bisphosphate aldolase